MNASVDPERAILYHLGRQDNFHALICSRSDQYCGAVLGVTSLYCGRMRQWHLLLRGRAVQGWRNVKTVRDEHSYCTRSEVLASVNITNTLVQECCAVWIGISFLKFLGVGWDWLHLVRRSLIGLLYQPRMIDDECGAVGMSIGSRNRGTRRKPAPVPLRPPQIPCDLTLARTRAAAVGSQRLTAWAMARPEIGTNFSMEPVFPS
jgi:hypothetical protein